MSRRDVGGRRAGQTRSGTAGGTKAQAVLVSRCGHQSRGEEPRCRAGYECVSTRTKKEKGKRNTAQIH